MFSASPSFRYNSFISCSAAASSIGVLKTSLLTLIRGSSGKMFGVEDTQNMESRNNLVFNELHFSVDKLSMTGVEESPKSPNGWIIPPFEEGLLRTWKVRNRDTFQQIHQDGLAETRKLSYRFFRIKLIFFMKKFVNPIESIIFRTVFCTHNGHSQRFQVQDFSEIIQACNEIIRGRTNRPSIQKLEVEKYYIVLM